MLLYMAISLSDLQVLLDFDLREDVTVHFDHLQRAEYVIDESHDSLIAHETVLV